MAAQDGAAAIIAAAAGDASVEVMKAALKTLKAARAAAQDCIKAAPDKKTAKGLRAQKKATLHSEEVKAAEDTVKLNLIATGCSKAKKDAQTAAADAIKASKDLEAHAPELAACFQALAATVGNADEDVEAQIATLQKLANSADARDSEEEDNANAASDSDGDVDGDSDSDNELITTTPLKKKNVGRCAPGAPHKRPRGAQPPPAAIPMQGGIKRERAASAPQAEAGTAGQPPAGKRGKL